MPAARAALLSAALLLGGCAPAPEGPGPLLPGLDRALPTLDRVVVEQGDGVLALRRDGDRWLIDGAAWRADPRWLQPLLLGLAEARCDEPRTADPQRYGRIGVAWPPTGALDEGAAFARPTARLALAFAGSERRVVVGHAHPRGGTFVRVEGAPHSCLTRVDLRLPARAADWLDPMVWSPPPGPPAWIEVSDGDAPALRLVARDGRYVADSRTGPPVDARADALAAALQNLRQRGLREPPAAAATGGRVLRFETTDGGRWALAIERDGAATLARIIEAPPAQGDGHEGLAFELPPDVADPLWADRAALAGADAAAATARDGGG